MTALATDLRPALAFLPAQWPPPRGRTTACVMAAVPGSVPALRQFARGTARRWSLPAVDEALALVVTELVTNAVRHSGSPDVAVLLTADTDTLTVQVKDSGRWRPRQTSRPSRADGQACGGRGLPLVEAHTTGLALWRTAAGTRVVAELPLALP